jgi:hypothetical protein
MTKKATPTAEAIQAKPPKSHTQRAMVSQAKASLAKRTTKKIGAPTKYSETMADTFCLRISQGETITKVCKALNVSINTIYEWAEKYPSFHEKYNLARKNQAHSLISQLVDEFQENLTNENALAARTKSDLYKWIAARQAPTEFGDVKRVQLSGEISHKHVHELAADQKARIAESWLMSQQSEDSPGIVAETTGPDLEAVGVQVVDDQERREVPRRKKPAQTKPKSQTLQDDTSGRWTGANSKPDKV